MGIKETLKEHVLPAGPKARTVQSGLARGLRMQIDFSQQTRQYFGIYEIELDRHLRRMLTPGLSAFDVGAQHGYDSLAIAKRTGARVAAFECESECLRLMQESFDLNPKLAPLIAPVSAMVGMGAGRLGLDEWAYRDGFVPDFVKIDIEGGELDALHSAAQILSERHPALVVEVHSRDLENEVGAFLISHGYRPMVISQRTLFPDRRPTLHNRWLVAE